MRIVTAFLLSMLLSGSPTSVLAAGAAPEAPVDNMAEASPDALADATTALQHGVYGDTPTALIEARGSLERLSAAAPNNALLHYYVALADWRLVPRVEDKKRSKLYCMEGIERCERALEIDPEFAEALALKAGLQGLSIQFNPMSGMTLGPEMETSTKRAIELAPDNPRVHFLDALNTLHKPSFVGGGAKNAMPKFAKAQALFAGELASNASSDANAPSWGHEDACLWAGRTAMKLEDYDAARAFYNKALTINPKNEWVRNVLLPEAEEKLEVKGKGKAKS